MRHGMLMGALGGMVVMFLLLAAPAGAQFEDCEVCDDSDWTDTKCVDADWTEMGSTECEAPSVGQCPDDPKLDCWGDDPHFASSLQIRPDGTLAWGPAVEAAESVDVQAQRKGLEAFGFSGHARITERSCKGLILDRLYGESTARKLAEQTELIVI
jgi:hypothetical protein